ncbi:hypothetical protein EIL50_04780 [bacterium NHP-B]|nr:hypothetical protein EIL50_04780 [bacterium NHP-B]
MKKKASLFKAVLVLAAVGGFAVLLMHGLKPASSHALIDEDGRLLPPLVAVFASVAECVRDTAFTFYVPTHIEEANALGQSYFLRQPGKERKDAEDTPFVEALRPCAQTLLPSLTALGAVAAVYPRAQHYDAVVVHGASAWTLDSRLRFVKHLLASQKVTMDRLYIITGARDLWDAAKEEDKGHPEKDEKAYVEQANAHTKSREDHDPVPSLTFVGPTGEGNLCYETDAAGVLVQAINFGDKVKEIVVISAPKNEGRRPNTADTVGAWKTYLDASHTQPTTVLAISNNPHILYQDAALRQVLATKGWGDVQVETVGAGVCGLSQDGKPKPCDDIDLQQGPALRNILDALARALYMENKLYQENQTQPQ